MARPADPARARPPGPRARPAGSDPARETAPHRHRARGHVPDGHGHGHGPHGHPASRAPDPWTRISRTPVRRPASGRPDTNTGLTDTGHECRSGRAPASGARALVPLAEPAAARASDAAEMLPSPADGRAAGAAPAQHGTRSPAVRPTSRQGTAIAARGPHVPHATGFAPGAPAFTPKAKRTPPHDGAETPGSRPRRTGTRRAGHAAHAGRRRAAPDANGSREDRESGGNGARRGEKAVRTRTGGPEDPWGWPARQGPGVSPRAAIR